MNKFKKIFYLLPLLLLIPFVGLLFPSSVEAAQFYFTPYELAKNEVADENIYVVADEVKIDGIVNGDVIVLGDLVEINGTITGDAHIMGSKIDINGSVYGTTFILGNNSTVNGLLAENTYIFSTFLNYGADTGKDMFAFFVESTLGGSVSGDLRAVGVRSSIESIVNDELVAIVNEYSVEEERIAGEIYDGTSIQEIAGQQGVEIDRAFNVEMPSFRPTWRLNVLGAFTGFLSMLLVGFIIILVAPVKAYAIKERISDSSSEFFASLAVGFVVLVLIPFPLFVLFISIVGAPAAFMILGILIFILTFGRIWVEMAFGKEVLQLFGVEGYRPYKSFLVGRVLSTFINLIPIVGGIYNSILGMVALGAILRVKRGYYQIATEEAKKYKKKSKTKKTTSKKKY
jgi:hypothetical protein